MRLTEPQRDHRQLVEHDVGRLLVVLDRLLDGLGCVALVEEPLLVEEPVDEAADAEPAAPTDERPLIPEMGAIERLRERRSEPTVTVPPGLPVPSYPVVVNAPVEAVIDHFVASRDERVFRKVPLPWQPPAPDTVVINPLYTLQVAGGSSTLSLTFPTAEYEDEFAAAKRMTKSR